MSIDSVLASTGANVSGNFAFDFGNSIKRSILTNSNGHLYAIVCTRGAGPYNPQIVKVDKSTDAGATWVNVAAANQAMADVGFDISWDGTSIFPHGDKFYVMCWGFFQDPAHLGDPSFAKARLIVRVLDTIAETWSTILPASFSTGFATSTSQSPDGGIVVKSNGHPVIFWNPGIPGGVDPQPCVSEYNGSSWSTPAAPSWGTPGFVSDNFPVGIALANDDRVRLFVCPYGEFGARNGNNLLHCSWDGATFGAVQIALTDFWTGAQPPGGSNPGPICVLGQGLGYLDGGSNKKFAIPYYTYNVTPQSGIGQITSSTLNNGGAGWLAGQTFTVDDGNFDATGVVDSVDGTGRVLTYHLTASGTDYESSETIDCYRTGNDSLSLNIVTDWVPYSINSLVVKCLHGNDDVADPTWLAQTIETSATLESPGPYNGYGTGLYPYVRENRSSLVASGGTLRMFYAVNDFHAFVGYIKKADWNGTAWSSLSAFRSGDFSAGAAYMWGVTGIAMDTALYCQFLPGAFDFEHIYSKDLTGGGSYAYVRDAARAFV